MKQVPAKPAWFGNVDGIVESLRSLPRPLIDRATVEALLGVGRRRAQQIMAPCIAERVGTSGLADRDALIQRLEHLARGDEAVYEVTRRRKVAILLERMRQERLDRPQLLVEAPAAVINQELENLPPGCASITGALSWTSTIRTRRWKNCWHSRWPSATTLTPLRGPQTVLESNSPC